MVVDIEDVFVTENERIIKGSESRKALLVETLESYEARQVFQD
jgi:hypothetical protein